MRFKALFEFKNRFPFLNELNYGDSDSFLWQLFAHQQSGVYVDICAQHPVKHSNTFRFYKKGWRGININPAPSTIMAFEALRPGDVNLQLSVADRPETVPFFVFNEPLHGAGYNDVAIKDKSYNSRIKDVITVKADTLANILDVYLPQGRHIDMLIINTGADNYKTLSSGNWTKYRPAVIVLESELSYNGFNNCTLNRLMIQKGYGVFAKKGKTFFLKDTRL